MSDQAGILRTPVAFLIFNRPEPTRRVASQIAKARPPKVMIIADGPRPGHPTDGEQTRLTRAVIEEIDWPCEVVKNYATANEGMRDRTVNGLNWVFDSVEEAIFVEDDCLPDLSFFRFCDELLDHYRFDEHVMMVSGDNFLQGGPPRSYSYFSRPMSTPGVGQPGAARGTIMTRPSRRGKNYGRRRSRKT
jgi:hypothetical protein